ncbi:DNA repair helicase [Athelia psychrophila]|uniref:ATP-dependent DNA helicase CHL1 n=1 Tax=Athelia psychrophila TaxID=1759441 RepID=A0A166U851_9AGAM|nr:DNA repair helicase [Fibularhizoctonia sp. CBS 109695]
MDFSLTPPKDFPAFPYTPPYSIQDDLMHHLYMCIEDRKVSIVESPTGTGKTLSLLCASLTWLADDKERIRKGQILVDSSAGEPDWVTSQTMERRQRELEAEELDYETRLIAARKKEAAMRQMAKARVIKRPRMATTESEEPDYDVFLPDADEDSTDNISPAVRALMAKLDKGSSRTSKLEESEPTCTKIYYASRTHSQLTQIFPELCKLKPQLKATAFMSNPSTSLSSVTHKRPHDEESESLNHSQWRTVSLGSRKQLCINDELRAKGGDLDEKCREMLTGTKGQRCSHLPSPDEDSRMMNLRDQILASPKDIEELATAGRLSGTCPYFGSRRAIPQAQLVTLPYNLLLSKTAREALGIDLTNQIVIVDEAHNLISTLLSLSTVRLSLQTLETSLAQVSIYLTKFRTRLTAKHALHLKRLVQFLAHLRDYAMAWLAQKKDQVKLDAKTEIMTVAELMPRLGRKVEGTNLLEIEEYLRTSKIARKISGYSEKMEERAAEKDPKHPSQIRRGATPPLHSVEAFMLALTSANDEGRICFSVLKDANQQSMEMKFQLLNPASPFREVVDTARSVILAGGTMSPVSDVVAQLFSHLPEPKICYFSCGHIIPSANLQTLIVGKGPRGGDLEFKFDRRGDKSMTAELGQIISNFVNVVPGGMVVFFPSYSFLNMVREQWGASGLIERFNIKKKLFLEPSDASEVDTVLREYAAACNPQQISTGAMCKGALLFAVIGAKLSEGLNFSDDLARAVVIVGLPFANLGSPELRERMKYVNRLQEKTVRKPGQKDAASELYENMCMNAVNQSIGRAIRHRGDWASLILIDRRYSSSSIRRKLPKWIGDGTVVAETFGSTMKHLGQFFRTKKPTQQSDA